MQMAGRFPAIFVLVGLRGSIDYQYRQCVGSMPSGLALARAFPAIAFAPARIVDRRHVVSVDDGELKVAIERGCVAREYQTLVRCRAATSCRVVIEVHRHSHRDAIVAFPPSPFNLDVSSTMTSTGRKHRLADHHRDQLEADAGSRSRVLSCQCRDGRDQAPLRDVDAELG